MFPVMSVFVVSVCPSVCLRLCL